MATILERIQEKYPGVTDDARNIAEALGMVSGAGGRGSGNIADAMNARAYFTFKANGGTGEDFVEDYLVGSKGMIIPECPFEAPSGKLFDYWYPNAAGVNSSAGRIYPGLNQNLTVPTSTGTTFYAIWKDAE